MYMRYRGCEATIEGKKYMIVAEGDCFAKW
jgi:co-chaperonin GroES (HSP10)